jgi:two-component system cell cycle sensor histidine kinase/response regulator CckA
MMAVGVESLAALRILFIEDSQDDVDLTVRLLRKEGFEATFARVDTREAMQAALREASWDLVLSDFSMPHFSAPDALATLKATGLDIPFIIVSGTMGEETAVASMRLGAQDYFVKGNLARLAPAVERELRERRERRARADVEDKLRSTEARYQALFEASPLPMWVLHRETLRFLAVNRAAVQHYGYTREDFEAMRVTDIRMPDGTSGGSAPGVVKRDGTSGGSAPGVVRGGTEGVVEAILRDAHALEGHVWRHRKKDGTLLLVELKAHDFDFAGRPSRLVLVNDVTERIAAEEARHTAHDALAKTEEQLRHAQKMEAVGRLAGGVAHDFNNLLSVVLSYTSLMLTELDAEDPIRDDLGEILRAGERATDLTRQLLAFSRQQVLQPRVLDLNHSVAGIERMLTRLLGADVEVVRVEGTDLGKIRADPGQIEQILMNLAVNARDAMPTGGKLMIRTESVDLDEAFAAEHLGVRPGPYVKLTVTDTGVGMDKEVMARIFEPFFTTKPRGRGTGLGLSTVFGIVKQSLGHIWVTSEPGKGTSFEVVLPCTDRAGDSSHPEPAASETLRGTETILVVEDDDQVRAVARGILRRSGYTVLEAPGPGEAILVSEQHPGEIHLLLTDVVLPRMNGPQLVERLAAVRPDMKVLFMSGYTDETISRRGILDSGFSYLQKPLRPEALTSKVRDVLGQRSLSTHPREPTPGNGRPGLAKK